MTSRRFTDRAIVLLEEGRSVMREAKRLHLARSAEAEDRGREGLRILRRAMDWGEEEASVFGDAHAELDAAGRWVRNAFGCRLAHVGSGYRRTCPVDLAHTRAGMSVAMFVKQAECSICGRDPQVCEHITGREYDGEFCYRRITEAELLEVSIVGRPADPDARIESLDVPRADLAEVLGPRFEPGMDVSCDLCLKGCPGLTYLGDKT